MLLGRVVVTNCIFSSDHFLKHSCSVHFCLMNLVMISQTAQCWSSDVSLSFEVGERDFLASENERLTMLSVIIVQFVSFELY